MAPAGSISAAQLAPIVAQFGGALTSEGVNKETCRAVATKLNKLLSETGVISNNEDHFDPLAGLRALAARLAGRSSDLNLATASGVLHELSSFLQRLVRPAPLLLPPEIIRLILLHARPTNFSRDLRHHLEYDREYFDSIRLLQDASLVHSSWTAIAQEILFERVFATGKSRLEVLKRLVETRPHLAPYIREVRLVEGSRDDERILDGVAALRGFPKVERLSLFNLDLVSSDLGDISDLVSLECAPISHRQRVLPESTSLRHLKMLLYQSTPRDIVYDFPLYPALVSLEVQSIDRNASPQHTQLRQFASTKTDTLIALSISTPFYSSNIDSFAILRWIEILPSFNSLRSLRLIPPRIAQWETICENLPPNLEILWIGVLQTGPSDNRAEPYLAVLNFSHSLVSSFVEAFEKEKIPKSLRVVRFGLMPREDGDAEEEDPWDVFNINDDLIVAFSDAGVEFEIGGVHDWRPLEAGAEEGVDSSWDVSVERARLCLGGAESGGRSIAT